MKVTSIELTPENSSDTIVMSFKDPSGLNPFNVRTIAGLDADEISPRFYGFGSGGLARFYDLSMQKRNVVARISLNPRLGLGESFSTLRDELYRLISASRTGRLQLRFKNGTSDVADIWGFITKVEAPQFEKTQEVVLTLSCEDDPMLRSPNIVMVDLLTLDPDEAVVNDILSTAPKGFEFEVVLLADDPYFRMYDPVNNWEFSSTPPGGFLTGDILGFSSYYNNKYFYMMRGAVVTHIADTISPSSVWPIIFPGVNTFGLDFPVTWNKLAYYPAYWGV